MKKHANKHLPFKAGLRKCGVLLLSLCWWLNTNLHAQDFTGIGKRKPFSFSGHVGAQSSVRLLSDGRSDPFAYLLSAQLNPVVYGFALPLSLSFADSRFAYAQPFSRLSFNPSYKWVKAYLGRTSMNMHPYGLSGQQFDGAGISLEPPNFPLHFSAMYGRLAKAQKTDYKRTAMAFNAGFTHKKQQMDMHFFRAVDRHRAQPEALAQGKTPQENMVLAMNFAFDLYKGLLLKGQAGLSAVAEDVRVGKDRFNPKRAASSLSTAFKIQVAHQGLSLSYERISPEYRSFGAPYFNQDFENAVVSFAHAFKKVDLSADIGWQRDDLKNLKSSRMNRVVGSAYINYRPNEKFTLCASYSNFTMHTQLKPMELNRPDDPLLQDPDTIAYRQIAQQAAFSLDFRSDPYAERKQQAGLELSYQSSREKSQQMFSDYVYAALRHGIELHEGYRLQSALNFSTRIDGRAGRKAALNYHIGPSVSGNKTFFDNTLHLSAGLNYYMDMEGGKASGGIADLRLRGAYTLKKAHEFELQMSGKLRTAFNKDTFRAGQEFFVQAVYRYRFNISPFDKKKQKSPA